jgi:hypothetical protein
MKLSAIRGYYTAAKYYSIRDNSVHVHGTRVPVEEPSTASKADISQTLFNHLVGPGEK